jgi:hypothetical protein
MKNTRKNALHKNLTIDHFSKVREALEGWVLDGEKFSVIQDEVEDIMVNLQDFMDFNGVEAK